MSANQLTAAGSLNRSATPTVTSLPREMKESSYELMYKLEETHWWFVGRRQIVRRVVTELLGGKAPTKSRTLDVGCGTGGNLEMLRRLSTAEGVDISEDALRFCRERGLSSVQNAPAEQLPFEDEVYDLITSLDVLEHTDDDLTCLREMRRVLRPGGHIVLFVPAFMFLWSAKDVFVHHRRRYTTASLRLQVERAGFEIERLSYANFFAFPAVALARFVMRFAGINAGSEEGVNVDKLNKLMGCVFGSEGRWLRRRNFPFGVSVLCVARRTNEQR